jgi:putative FmdB family regulatory protein
VPLYEYKCVKCGRSTEKIEHVSGPHLKKCPHCGGKVEPVLSAPAIQFKGSGWYVTDYAGKSNSGAAAESGASGAKESGKEGAGKDGAGKEAAAKDAPAKESASKETSTKDKKTTKK